MKRALLAAALCLVLTSCRSWKAATTTAAPPPTQGTASVQSTIANPDR